MTDKLAGGQRLEVGRGLECGHHGGRQTHQLIGAAALVHSDDERRTVTGFFGSAEN